MHVLVQNSKKYIKQDVLRRIKRFKPSYDVTKGYPHNLMRNAALRGVLTGHVMSLDAGMTPPSGLKKDINALIGNETDEKFVLFVKHPVH